MQGITEAVSRYYFSNGESFEGLSVTPEYQEAFERLAQDAKSYYDSPSSSERQRKNTRII